MNKIYRKMSTNGKIFNILLGFSNYKKNFMSDKAIKKYISKLDKKNKKYDLPKRMQMYKEVINEMDTYSLNGTIDKPKKKILLYIHGGSFIENAVYFQIKFVEKLAKATDSTLVFPIYPLAPKHDYRDMYKLINELYKKLLNTNCEINFLGDSAGAGFILSYSMYLKKHNIKQPNNIIMISPWLDISLSNPKLVEYEKKDVMSGIYGNRYAGNLWKGNLDSKSYLVSPMYGELEGLNKMTIIVGDKDLLKPDVDIFIEKLQKSNVEYNYIEYKNQYHDFAMYPTKEGNIILKDVQRIINGEKYEK